MTSDLIALTETQIYKNQYTGAMEQTIQPNMIKRHDHDSDKYQSLSCLIFPSVNFVEKNYFPSINGWLFGIEQDRKICSILLLYRKHSIEKRDFLNRLYEVITCSESNVDIIMGDFNIDYRQDNDPESSALDEMMTSFQYRQVTNEATFIRGSLLDHVYVRFHQENLPSSYVRPVYFSDHDAVCFSV